MGGKLLTTVLAGSLACAATTMAQPNPSSPPRPPAGPPSLAALAGGSHAQAMRRLSFLDGVWAGEAVTRLPGGGEHRIWQTERFGDMLGGDVKVVEGRGYEPDGRLSFNAFGVISYDPNTDAYSFRTYAAGQAGTFPATVRPDGYVWEIPAGPATLRYTTTVANGRFREVGERIVAGQPPMPFFEMNLRRVGDTDWPAGGAVPATAGR